MAVDEAVLALVRDELRRASDVGEERSRAALQEACGLGAGDLEAALEELRVAGVATQVVPDGFALLQAEADDEEPEPVEEPGLSLEEAERRAAGWTRDVSPPAPGSRQRALPPVARSSSATVTMPRAMVDAIDSAALGALLKAGIEAASDGEAFVFEVTP